MEKIKIYISTVIFVSLLVSCGKFLDTMPLDKMDPEAVFDKESQIYAALVAAYDPLGRGSVYGYTIQVRMATEADEGFNYSSSRTTGPQVYNLTSSDPDVLAMWTTLYEGISRANLVLENVDRPVMDETRRKYIKGEALFLRAYYYFLLVSNWGDVPLILNTVTSVEGNAIERTPANLVYEQITSDMKQAEELVMPIEEYDGAGRVTKSAVRGVLARVYLYWAGYPLMKTEKYEDARSWAKKVIDDTEAGHRLNPSYDQVFINYAQDKYDNKESIWEVEFAVTGIYEHGQVGSWLGIRSTNPDIGTAYGFNATTHTLYDRYKAGDLRRDRAIAPFYYNEDGDKIFFLSTVTSRRYPGKWRREEETALPKLNQNTPQNYPLLRYSDVLLMFAEADYQVNNQSPTNDAYVALNDVRRRGYGKYLNGGGEISESIKSIHIVNGGTGYTSNPTITITGGGGEGATATATQVDGEITTITITNPGRKFTSLPVITVTGGGGTGAVLSPELTLPDDADLKNINDDDFMEALQEERSRELCFEGLRKYDLIRWGLLETKLKEVGAWIKAHEQEAYKYVSLSFDNFDKSKHTLLPIPQNDISLNGLLTQNPGY
ncbi:RagB/SusD family nutrient uptake outer membrane protein [Sphingobacterium sp. SGG-5]|uniref:RagB/SusD family nutrient uptake outer membrane protein n=1 Tax=Sphingobacterium sp. SGG-5 TaxID=2710881 RepID=UPI0013EE23E7|nr:RagB/SusD family nutrient uptake outer membrane protein [Sphingobacterium sp. SGG-5]NGM62650.1 RagB/SusD family nutrient uptake outer membrane protein [Sphingobacterium sp. SGG-5]